MGERPEAQPTKELIVELADRLGRDEFTAVCVDLMRGAPREDHLDALPWLTGHDWSAGEPVRDPTTWHDYWLRTWGARGLLHVWDDAATECRRGRARRRALAAGRDVPEGRRGP